MNNREKALIAFYEHEGEQIFEIRGTADNVQKAIAMTISTAALQEGRPLIEAIEMFDELAEEYYTHFFMQDENLES